MIRFGQVTAVHSARRTMDMVDTESGTRYAEVHFASGPVSTDSGSWNTPAVPKPANAAAAGGVNPSGRTLIAVFSLFKGRPVILGFHSPSGSQMGFTEDNREVHRHPSGAYTTIAPDGSIETYHPSGAYVRVGTGDHQDLAAVSTGAWVTETGAPPAQITVSTQGFKAVVMPGGNTVITSDGTLQATYQGNATIETMGALMLKAATVATLSAPAIVLDGPITQGKGPNGGGASMEGPVLVVNDVVAGDISLQTHRTSEVQPGSGTSGVPVP
jgi:hypothetical protein